MNTSYKYRVKKDLSKLPISILVSFSGRVFSAWQLLMYFYVSSIFHWVFSKLLLNLQTNHSLSFYSWKKSQQSRFGCGDTHFLEAIVNFQAWFVRAANKYLERITHAAKSAPWVSELGLQPVCSTHLARGWRQALTNSPQDWQAWFYPLSAGWEIGILYYF